MDTIVTHFQNFETRHPAHDVLRFAPCHEGGIQPQLLQVDEGRDILG